MYARSYTYIIVINIRLDWQVTCRLLGDVYPEVQNTHIKGVVPIPESFSSNPGGADQGCQRTCSSAVSSYNSC